MAKLVFGMNQSLDGYVAYTGFAPSPKLFRYFIEQTGKQTGSLYGRGLYEIMRYWDDDQPDWGPDEKAPKWVVSHSLKSVGPNATLLGDDLEAAVRKLKAEQEGVIDVGGPVLARSLSDLGLIDEYCIYLHPVVLGSGDPFFVGARPPLRFAGSEQMDENVIRLTYVPA